MYINQATLCRLIYIHILLKHVANYTTTIPFFCKNITNYKPDKTKTGDKQI